MRLKEVNSVVEFGHWAKSKGFLVGEGPDPFGPVARVHSSTSLHYRDLALDINYTDDGKWLSESAALKWLYFRIKLYRRLHPKFPLDEMFHNGWGYRKETGLGQNTPIDNHETHLHIGFYQKTWS